MRRRDFITLIGGVATAWPLAARAQEPGRTYRLGDLHLSPRNASYNVALFDAVKPDGFIDGKNLVVDDRGFGLRIDDLADMRQLSSRQKWMSLFAPVIRAFAPRNRQQRPCRSLAWRKIW